MNTLNPIITEYLRQRLARGEISRRTAHDYNYTLAGLAESYGRRPGNRFGPAAVDRWLESIGHMAPATRREYLSRVRGFCQWMHANGLATSDASAHVPAVRQPRQVPRTLTRDEVRRLYAACPDERARAIVALMVGCGCRCVEVSRLNVGDYDADALTVTLVGKGGHERRLPVPDETADAIGTYLDLVGRPGGPMIRRVDGGRMAAKTLSSYLRRWLLAADVKTTPLDGRSAHALRRTAASDVMDFSGDVRAVQEMLGHARIETTARAYLRPVSLMALRTAMGGREYVGLCP